MMHKRACGGLCWPLTCTDDTGILHVPAVVHAPAVVPAHLQGGLVPAALHVVQEDAAGAGAKVRSVRRSHGLATAQLPAHHLGIPQVPLVITHRPPRAAVVQLHAALAAVPAARQPHAGPWHTAQSIGFPTTQLPEPQTSQLFCRFCHSDYELGYCRPKMDWWGILAEDRLQAFRQQSTPVQGPVGVLLKLPGCRSH